jgi:hypothetical protein
MIVLGVILLILGFVLDIHILWIIGLALVLVGLVLLLTRPAAGTGTDARLVDPAPDHRLCPRRRHPIRDIDVGWTARMINWGIRLCISKRIWINRHRAKGSRRPGSSGELGRGYCRPVASSSCTASLSTPTGSAATPTSSCTTDRR